MKFVVKVEVSLKPGHSDPEGESVLRLLRELGYLVDKVGVSKVYTLVFEASSVAQASVLAEEMSERLFVNPTKDNCAISVVVE